MVAYLKKKETRLIPDRIDAYIVSKGINIFEERPSSLSTALKTIKPPTADTTVSFPYWIENLTASERTVYLYRTLKLDKDWSAVLVLNGKDISGETFPYKFSISKYSTIEGHIDIKVFAGEPKGKIGSVTLILEDSVDGCIYDSIKGVLSTWIADYGDVKKEAEMIAVSEALHPASAGVSAEAANEYILATENELLYSQCLERSKGFSLTYENIARQLITSRVLEKLLLKYSAYTLGGEVAFIRIIKQLKEKISDLTLALESAN